MGEFDNNGRFQPTTSTMMNTNASRFALAANPMQPVAPAHPAAASPNAPVTNQAVPQAPVQQPTGIVTPPQQPQRQLGAPPPFAQRPMPQQMYQNFQPPPPQQSVTQQAGRGGAQSVSNYLQALQQNGSGGNNAMMNAPGQQGVMSNVGFQGFGQNGRPTQLGGQYVGPQQQNTQMQFAQNGAYTGGNYNIGNNAYQGGYGQAASPQLANTGGISTVNGPGLANGAQNAPQWQTPQPWGQPGNNLPGVAGSYIPNTSQGWETVFNLPQGVNGVAPVTPGAFYSTQGTDPNNPGPPIDSETSDVRAKEKISSAASELQEFMDNLGVYSYEYKDKAHGEGRYISPMAQEFEKSKLGAQAVETGPDGLKKVNYGRLIGVQSAALALLNHKYNALEKKLNKSLKDNMSKRGKRG